MRKDVTAKCYGGDATGKRKLLDKQRGGRSGCGSMGMCRSRRRHSLPRSGWGGVVETLLRKDSDWYLVEGQICKVLEFTPLATVEDGEIRSVGRTMPYASVELQCDTLPHNVVGFITHKLDFEHLWAASNERTVGDDEELIIIRNKRGLKGLAKLFSAFMPKLVVWVCKRGAYELITTEARPDLRGEARFQAERPIVEWKPKVMV